MRRPARRWSGLTVFAVLALSIGGCFDSGDPEDTDPPPVAYPFPDTVEQLMTNFRDAYDSMNITEYDNVLHEDFRFIFAEGSDIDPDGYFTREEDLLSTTHMFNGEQGMSDIGEIKPGVRDIDFRLLTQLSPTWEVVPESDVDFPGASRAIFDVELVFNLRDDGNSTITIDSQQCFYVQSEPEEIAGGGSRLRYYLIGHRDLVNK
jgi:hypothetical protein